MIEKCGVSETRNDLQVRQQNFQRSPHNFEKTTLKSMRKENRIKSKCCYGLSYYN